MLERRGSIDRVVVINDDAVESGGAAIIALASARLLRDAGVPVTFVAGDENGSADVQTQGIDFAALGGRHILDGARGPAALRGLYDADTARALATWIADHDTPRTVYHLHNWHKVLSPSVFAPLRAVADRLVLTAHDYFLTCPNGGYFVYPRQSPCELRPGGWQCLVTDCDRRHYGHKLWRFVRHQIRRALLDLAHSKALVLAVHDGLVPYLLRAGLPGEQVRVLRNPVAAWQPRRVAANHNTDFFFIGRVDEDKGADLFADALAITGLPGQIIGAGALSEPLARSHPGLRIHGWQARDRIAELAADARAVVLPTRSRETFGIVALEALMSGIPVIVSRFAAIADEVQRNGVGAVCHPYDVDALAFLLEEFADDDRGIEEMSRRAIQCGRSMAPTHAEWTASLLEIYQERLGSSAPPSRPLRATASPVALPLAGVR